MFITEEKKFNDAAANRALEKEFLKGIDTSSLENSSLENLK